MNCSQLIFGADGTGEAAGETEIGGGGGWYGMGGIGGGTTSTCFGKMKGCGAMFDGGGEAGRGEAEGAGWAETGWTGDERVFSCFNRKISVSNWSSRRESSLMWLLALVARVINQIVTAMGIPIIAKTMRAMPESIISFSPEI
jgi:hypothetical protein